MASQMQFKDVRFEKLVDEAGDTIDGLSDAALSVQIELDDGHDRACP